MEEHIEISTPRDFARSLRERLLTDRYGGWRSLDPDLLDGLCDRMAVEAWVYSGELLSEAVEERVSEIKEELEKAERDYDSLLKDFRAMEETVKDLECSTARVSDILRP